MTWRNDLDHARGECDSATCPACEAERDLDESYGIYDCAICRQRTDPTWEPSPCEGHAEPVGACCAPCDDCRDEAIEAADNEMKRGAA